MKRSIAASGRRDQPSRRRSRLSAELRRVSWPAGSICCRHCETVLPAPAAVTSAGRRRDRRSRRRHSLGGQERHPVQRDAFIWGETDRHRDLAGEPPPAQRRQITSVSSGSPPSVAVGLNPYRFRKKRRANCRREIRRSDFWGAQAASLLVSAARRNNLFLHIKPHP